MPASKSKIKKPKKSGDDDDDDFKIEDDIELDLFDDKFDDDDDF